jgi:hypothetical protein
VIVIYAVEGNPDDQQRALNSDQRQPIGQLPGHHRRGVAVIVTGRRTHRRS